MEHKRFFVDNITSDKVIISGQEFLHMTKVLRLKIGYEIILCDNSNFDFYAKITNIQKDSAEAVIFDKKINYNETRTQVILFQALCKEFDFIVQKAVELGVTKIVPYISKFTNVKSINHDRLEKIIINASKQCNRAKVMQLNPVISFNDALEYTKKDLIPSIIFYEACKENIILSIDNRDISKVGIFIGSEGGFSIEEIDLAKSYNLEVASLGKRILRAETACIVATTLVLNELGELK